MKRPSPCALLSAVSLALVPTLSARNFFELSNQGFQNGGRSGLPTDSVYLFNGPVFAFQEPDYLGPKSGLADDNPEGPTLWGRLLGGYDSNVAGYKAGAGSWFGGVQVGASENFAIGRQNVFVGARLRFVQYEDDIFRRGRDGNDSGIYDLDLRLGLNRQISKRFALASFYSLNIGGSREFGQPYLLPGISRQDEILYRGVSQAVYRFDRAVVNDPGLQFTTALHGVRSKGLDHDDRDFGRTEVRQGVDYIVRDTQAFGLEGRVGFNSWEQWKNLDSNSYRLLATTGGRLANGIYYHAAAGWEWWAYDEENIIDDRDDFYAEVKISGEVTDQFYVAGGLTYGIETVRPARNFNSADPMGLKAALTGVFDHGPYAFAALLTYTCYEADLLASAKGRWDRWSAGISIDREMGANSRAGIAFEYAGIDTHRDNFEDIETTFRWTTDF